MTTLIIEDLPLTVRELEKKKMENISGGMIKRTDDALTPAGDEGVTWVPEGTVKVYLGGVQIM